MKNLKLKNKVLIGILIIVIINILLGSVTSVFEMNNRKKNALVINELAVIHSLKDGQIYHIDWNNDLRQLIDYNSPFNWELDPLKCDFGIWITSYLESNDFRALPKDIRLDLSKMNEYYQEIHRTTQAAVDEYNMGDKDSALSLCNNEVKKSIDNMMNMIDQTETSLQEQVGLTKDDITDLSQSINLFSLLAVIISIITAGIILLFLNNATFRPLSRLIDKIKAMNKDEIYQEVKDIHSSNEMGAMLTVFNHMVRKVNSQQQKLQDQNDELLAQGEELAAQNEELTAQGEELVAQNNKILDQKKIMEKSIQQLKNQENQLRRLYQFSKILTETIDFDRMIEKTLDGMLDEVNAQAGIFYLFNQQKKQLDVKYSTGLSGNLKLPSLNLGEGLAGRAALLRVPVVADYSQSVMNSQCLQGEIKMMYEIYQPLIIQERLLGVIGLGRLSENSYSTAEMQLTALLADQISIALDNASNYRQTQEALIKIQEVDKLKSEMINTVSHELRTPLASILGFTELMLKKSPNEVKAKKYLTTIYSEADRLKLLINDFLDLQKIETGHFVFTKQPVNLKELIQYCISLYEGQGHTNHSFSLHIDDNLPMIMTDPDKIEQVIGNLLSNAIKYSPKGGPIEIIVSRFNSSQLIISVKDFGLGIPEDAIKRLFQPFYRVDNSDRREIGGTGLGLVICYKIIKALGGDIWVESIHGHGSTFRFTIPASDTDEGRTEEPTKKEQLIEDQKNVVMIVEDDQSLSSLLKEAFNDEGYETILFDNGPSALSFLEKQIPEAIILDIILNGPLDGWEILRRLKQNGKTKDIPVIISSSIDQKQKIEEYQVTDYFVKPFPPEKLVHCIDSIILSKGGYVGIPHTEKTQSSEVGIKQVFNNNGFTVRDIQKDEHVFMTDIIPDKISDSSSNI